MRELGSRYWGFNTALRQDFVGLLELEKKQLMREYPEATKIKVLFKESIIGKPSEFIELSDTTDIYTLTAYEE